MSLTVPFTVLVPDNVSAKGTPSVAKVKDIGDVAKILTTEGTFLQGSGTSGHADVQMGATGRTGRSTPNGAWIRPQAWFFQVNGLVRSGGFITVPFVRRRSAHYAGACTVPCRVVRASDLAFPRPGHLRRCWDPETGHTAGGVSLGQAEDQRPTRRQLIKNGVPIGGLILLLALSWTRSISVGWAKGSVGRTAW